MVDVFHLFHVLHVLHVAHVLQTYFMFSHPGWQDGTISAALVSVMSKVTCLNTIESIATNLLYYYVVVYFNISL